MHPEITKQSVTEMYKHIYWKRGATELATGKQTLTLRQFDEKYGKEFVHLSEDCIERNLYAKFRSLPKKDQESKYLIAALRNLDSNININWCLMHYKSAVKYLQGDPDIIAATGGTNWQKYLPPRFQKIIFFPELWTDLERKEWGKTWVEKQIAK